MPKRDDIKSILIIGAGPIVIGQACEFDYSGTQACKALKEEGYRIILLNSNPATIMTDPGLADATYIEPITAEAVKIILEKEIKGSKMLPQKLLKKIISSHQMSRSNEIYNFLKNITDFADANHMFNLKSDGEIKFNPFDFKEYFNNNYCFCF